MKYQPEFPRSLTLSRARPRLLTAGSLHEFTNENHHHEVSGDDPDQVHSEQGRGFYAARQDTYDTGVIRTRALRPQPPRRLHIRLLLDKPTKQRRRNQALKSKATASNLRLTRPVASSRVQCSACRNAAGIAQVQVDSEWVAARFYTDASGETRAWLCKGISRGALGAPDVMGTMVIWRAVFHHPCRALGFADAAWRNWYQGLQHNVCVACGA